MHRCCCCCCCCTAAVLPLHIYVQWEGQHLKLTAVHAHGEPGFSMHMQFMVEEDFSSAVRHISVSWPADVTAQAIAALDDTMGFRPLAVRGT